MIRMSSSTESTMTRLDKELNKAVGIYALSYGLDKGKLLNKIVREWLAQQPPIELKASND